MPSEEGNVGRFYGADVDSVEEALGVAEERIASVLIVIRVVLPQSILQSIQQEMPHALFAEKPGTMSARVEDVDRRNGVALE